MKFKKQWTVMRDEQRGGSSIEWYASRDKANTVAKSKALKNIGVRFNVIEIVGTILVPPPVSEAIVEDI